MKKINFFKAFFALAISLTLVQCTSDDPIPGPAGADGKDGINGISGTTECVACHSIAVSDRVNASYALSTHAIETLHATKENGVDVVLKTSDYTNRTGCVQCHTSGGYIDKMNGDPLRTGAGASTGEYAYPKGKQAVTCVTCHSKHTSFDFVKDGYDSALRQGFTPVTLDVGGVIDMGTSNTCVNCHQTRSLPPTGSGNYTITSLRFGPHHGPQSSLLEGIHGALYVGSVPYPAPKSALHRTGASCSSCHMGAASTDKLKGDHTWHPNQNNCKSCHKTTVPTTVAGFATDMTTLENLLLAKKYINSDGYVMGGDGIKTASSTNPLIIPFKDAQAIWNYKYLNEDKSHGLHNPKYATALLKNSIQALQ